MMTIVIFMLRMIMLYDDDADNYDTLHNYDGDDR